MSARIINLTGNNQAYTMVIPELTIGRSLNNDITIPDPKVSQKHARIIKKPKGYYLEDLGSSNGTTFQGRTIQLVHLRNNDIFRIGNNDFKFIEESATVLDSPSPLMYDEKRIHNSSNSNSNKKQEISTSQINKSYKWVPWTIGGSILLILVVLFILFYPMYAVQTGTIVTCKHCSKEISNDVHSLKVSLLDKDNLKYVITRNKDYCGTCGSELVSYTTHYFCQFCGQEYNRVHQSSPRREEKQDQNLTQGYCNGYCAAGKKVEDYGNKANELIDKFTNPLEWIK